MRKLLYFSLLIGFMGFLFTGCKKDETRAILKPIENPELTLTNDKTDFVLDSTARTDTATVFQWNKITYNLNVSLTYTLEFVSADAEDYEDAILKTTNDIKKGITVNDLNSIAILSGLTPDVKGKIKVRVKAAVEGRNSAPQTVEPIYSNEIELTVTPYKPHTKYPVPEHLYLIGDAPGNDWQQPVPVPEQEFSKVNFYTFELKIHLLGGMEYVFIPVNGDWSHKYNVEDNSDEALREGGDFEPDAGDDNIPGPKETGNYKITVNFLSGRYEVTLLEGEGSEEPGTGTPTESGLEVPDSLFIVGGATLGGWDRPVAYPQQQKFTKVGDSTFETTVFLKGGEEYLLTPKNVDGNINEKYAVDDNTDPDAKTGTEFTVNSGSNIPAPNNDGWYKITVDFRDGTYQVEATSAPTPPGEAPDNLYILGNATDEGTTIDDDQKFDKIDDFTYQINIHLDDGKTYWFASEKSGGDQYKVDDGNSNDAKTGTAFTVNMGDDIPAPDNEGWYNIIVNFATGTYAVSAGFNPNGGTPTALFIVGDATQGGWDTPVPDPEQKFEKTGNDTFEGIFYLTGGKEYLLMPQNVSGNIAHKYGVNDPNDPDAKTGTDFVIDGGQNIPAPDNDGWYKITVDFDARTYTVENQNSNTNPNDIPDQLYILGSAVEGGWGNPVTDVSKQELTRVNAYLFTITTSLTKDEAYKFILEDGSWDTSIGVDDTNSADPLDNLFEMGSNPANIPSPDDDGTYKIEVNFLNYHYTLTKQ